MKLFQARLSVAYSFAIIVLAASGCTKTLESTVAPAVDPAAAPTAPVVAPSPQPQVPTTPPPVKLPPDLPPAAKTALDPLQAELAESNLFSFRSELLASEINERNQKLSQVLSSMPAAEKRDAIHRFNITHDEASTLYTWLDEHPVAAQSQIGKYDQVGGVGFCFGRAFTIHIELLSKNWKVSRDSIRKLWAIGPMQGGWGHHVAVIVRAAEGGWWVIDPVANRVVSASEWMKYIARTYEISPRDPLMFAVTKPERFGPELPRAYTQVDLYGPVRNDREIDFYHGFFTDVIKARRQTGDLGDIGGK
jgi:hypothetical protein